MNEPPEKSPRANRMLQKLTRRTRSRTGLWRSHLATFGATSAFLVFLDLITGGSTPWSIIVMSSWSIPLGLHAILKRRREKLKARLEELSGADISNESPAVDVVPDRVYLPLRKLHRSNTAFMLPGAIAGAASFLLVVINLIAGGPLWFPIPVASMALSMGLWAIFRKPRQQRLRAQLEQALQGGSSIGHAGKVAASHPQLDEAHRLRNRIARQLTEGGAGHGSLLSNVDQMTAEIARLARLDAVFQDAHSLSDPTALERDRRRIAARIENLASDTTDTDTLRKYEQSLAPIERELATISRLEQQHEMLQLRLRSAVSSLRQIHLDLVRMQGDTTLHELDSQSEELVRSLSDLRESYDELTEMLKNTK